MFSKIRLFICQTFKLFLFTKENEINSYLLASPEAIRRARRQKVHILFGTDTSVITMSSSSSLIKLFKLLHKRIKDQDKMIRFND